MPGASWPPPAPWPTPGRWTWAWRRLLLLICILMQASVNTFNDYFDFIKGTDTAEDNVEASDSVLVYNDVNPRSALGLAIGFLAVAFLLGLYVVWKAGARPPRHRAYRSRHRRDVLRRQDASLLPSRRRGGERHRYGRSYSAWHATRVLSGAFARGSWRSFGPRPRSSAWASS